jgi:hypothetical protein
VGSLAIGFAQANRNGPTGEIQLIPKPEDALTALESHRIVAVGLQYTVPASTKPNIRSVRSLPAPGKGADNSKLATALDVPPTFE